MKKIIWVGFLMSLLFFLSCKNKLTATENTVLPRPVVTVVHPTKENIQEHIQLNGQVIYQNKTTITAPISGYVIAVNTVLGNWVNKGKLLFKIQTKESKALQDANLSPSNQFGIIAVYASISGYVNALNITESGVFISEGNAMTTLVKNTDLLVQVNAPFEYNNLLKNKKNIQIELPNKAILLANFYKAMPVVDPVSQTQQILFKLKNYSLLPENLNVVVRFVKQAANNKIVLPKEVVLTNETQDYFWIMKVTKDSLAIKIPIKKGLENTNKIEILKPTLQLTDQIIQKGAFGLPDSTKVKIQ